MKALLLSGFVIALLTGGAFAQANGQPPSPPAPGMAPPPPPERAAHFRLQRGDALIDVKCADEESMKACGDLALQMVDRLQALPQP
jgi:hypothetical protein